MVLVKVIYLCASKGVGLVSRLVIRGFSILSIPCKNIIECFVEDISQSGMILYRL